MARNISHLEAAERDPAKLRRTGLTIAVVMMLGGIIITLTYIMKQRADAKDGRPHVVQRLTEKFGGRDQNNKAFTTEQLAGKISLITPLAGSEKERMAESLRMMKAVAETFPDEENLRFVGITVDPEQDGPKELEAMLDELGVGNDKRWIFVQAEEKNARGYLRHKLRLETEERIPSVDQGWIKRFRSTIVFIDENLHVLEPQYDFNDALEIQEDARRMLKDDPKRAEKLDAKSQTDAFKRTEERFFRTLEDIREGNLKEGKEP